MVPDNISRGLPNLTGTPFIQINLRTLSALEVDYAATYLLYLVAQGK